MRLWSILGLSLSNSAATAISEDAANGTDIRNATKAYELDLIIVSDKGCLVAFVFVWLSLSCSCSRSSNSVSDSLKSPIESDKKIKAPAIIVALIWSISLTSVL